MNRTERGKPASFCAGVALLTALVLSWGPVGPLMAEEPLGAEFGGVMQGTMTFLGQEVTVKRWTDGQTGTRHAIAEFPGGTVQYDYQPDGTVKVKIADSNQNSAEGTLVCDGRLTLGGTCYMDLNVEGQWISVDFTNDRFTVPTGALSVSGPIVVDFEDMKTRGVPPVVTDGALPGVDSVAVDGVEMLHFSKPVPFSQVTETTRSGEFGWLANMLNVNGPDRSIAGAILLGAAIALLFLIIDCLFVGWWCEVVPAWTPGERIKERLASSLGLPRWAIGVEVPHVAA